MLQKTPTATLQTIPMPRTDSDTIGSDGTVDTDLDALNPTLDVLPTVPPSTRPVELVKVAAVNGTTIRGLAGATTKLLVARGYVAEPKNAASPPVQESSIFYKPSYADDAKAVASALSAPADILKPAPDHIPSLIANYPEVSDFHIFVVLGTDSRIPVSVE